jgi:hypothetical protein
MDATELKGCRSEVIERAINAEWLVSAIICQHYFKKVFLPFLLEVLFDEQFSFSLKRRVFEKIVDHGDSKARIQDLNRLGTIRNYFAHCGQEIVPIETGEGYTPDPRKPDKPVDFAALYAEFREIAPRVELFLKDVFVSMGGRVSDTLPKAGQELRWATKRSELAAHALDVGRGRPDDARMP